MTEKLSACDAIRREILAQAARDCPDELDFRPFSTAGEIETAYGRLCDANAEDDYEQGFRRGQVETNIRPDGSRHYESKSVAAKLSDGSWVGWAYWYGGGKHGDPGAVDWMTGAYYLTCVEEEKLVVIRTFSKV